MGAIEMTSSILFPFPVSRSPLPAPRAQASFPVKPAASFDGAVRRDVSASLVQLMRTSARALTQCAVDPG
jgi:hypothetical protein